MFVLVYYILYVKFMVHFKCTRLFYRPKMRLISMESDFGCAARTKLAIGDQCCRSNSYIIQYLSSIKSIIDSHIILDDRYV